MRKVLFLLLVICSSSYGFDSNVFIDKLSENMDKWGIYDTVEIPFDSQTLRRDQALVTKNSKLAVTKEGDIILYRRGNDGISVPVWSMSTEIISDAGKKMPNKGESGFGKILDIGLNTVSGGLLGLYAYQFQDWKWAVVSILQVMIGSELILVLKML